MRLDPNCFKDEKWQSQLWEETVELMQDKNIKLVGEKFRRSLITYTYSTANRWVKSCAKSEFRLAAEMSNALAF